MNLGAVVREMGGEWGGARGRGVYTHNPKLLLTLPYSHFAHTQTHTHTHNHAHRPACTQTHWWTRIWKQLLSLLYSSHYARLRIYLQASFVQGTGPVANALAWLEEGLYAGVVLEPLELQVGAHVGVGVVQAYLKDTGKGAKIGQRWPSLNLGVEKRAGVGGGEDYSGGQYSCRGSKGQGMCTGNQVSTDLMGSRGMRWQSSVNTQVESFHFLSYYILHFLPMHKLETLKTINPTTKSCQGMTTSKLYERTLTTAPTTIRGSPSPRW